MSALPTRNTEEENKMKNIALTILSVGLMFYVTYRARSDKSVDFVAILIAICAAIAVFII